MLTAIGVSWIVYSINDWLYSAYRCQDVHNFNDIDIYQHPKSTGEILHKFMKAATTNNDKVVLNGNCGNTFEER